MSEKQDESTNIINSSTSVRMPLGLLATFVVFVGLALWARVELYHEQTNNSLNDIKKSLERKADKGETADRYTGSIAERDKALYEAADKALRRELMMHIKESDKIHEHIHDDVINHRHPHSEIIHENTH